MSNIRLDIAGPLTAFCKEENISVCGAVSEGSKRGFRQQENPGPKISKAKIVINTCGGDPKVNRKTGESH